MSICLITIDIVVKPVVEVRGRNADSRRLKKKRWSDGSGLVRDADADEAVPIVPRLEGPSSSNRKERGCRLSSFISTQKAW